MQGGEPLHLITQLIAAVTRPARLLGLGDKPFIPALSLVLVVFLFLVEGRIDFNWDDEGFLWYGAIRTAHGEVPLRDFEAYDPGRYYWCAGWLILLGDGIVSLRVALAAFQLAGLTLGLLAARRLTANRRHLALIGLSFALWMFPSDKVFEPSLALSAMYVAVRLIERPDRAMYFGAGAFVGFAGFMGRNHGLYCVTTFAALAAFLQWKTRAPGLGSRLLSGVAGVVVGYAPMLAMFVLVPGFFERTLVSVLTMLWRSTSMTSAPVLFSVPLPVIFNLSVPVPWPWRVSFSQLGFLGGVSGVSKGSLFLLYAAFPVAAGARLLATRTQQTASRSVLLASVVVGAPYMHHAFSRADLQHLAQSIHPLLLGIGALLLSFRESRRMAAFWLAFLIPTAVGALDYRPLGQWLRYPSEFVRYRVARDELWLPKAKAAHLSDIAQAVDTHARPSELVWLAPVYPGLYPVLGRRCPTWDIYPIFPERAERQQEIIRDLDRRGVSLALIADLRIDGRDDLRFRNTHRLVWDHLVKAFEEIRPSGLAADHSLWRRRPQARAARTRPLTKRAVLSGGSRTRVVERGAASP